MYDYNKVELFIPIVLITTANMNKITDQLSFQKTQTQLVISISGGLDLTSLAYLWDKVLEIQSKHASEVLVLDASKISYCDSAGAALILELRRRQVAANKKFYLQSPNDELQKIVNFLAEKEVPNICPSVAKDNFVVRIGKRMVSIVEDFRENIIFLGTLLYHISHAFLQRKTLRMADFWRAMEDVGPKAFPIIILIGFLVGLITTFQSAAPLGRFGAQIYIIDLVGLGLVREMGPLMTAVLLAGRTASSFAAEIGSMKINQEVDALTTLGLEPMWFLTMPRILATIIMTPILSIFLIVSALIGCFLVMLSLGYNLNIFLSHLYDVVTTMDFISGLIKTFVFGAVIASIGCLHGMKTSLGASAVGESTTKAVVNSLIMLVFVDGVFAAVYYALGI